MDLLKVYAGWKEQGTWIQAAFIIGFVGTVASILSLTGVHMPLTDLIIIALLCGFWLLFYGNIQQSKKLAKAEKSLGNINIQIDQATKAVYTQKNLEIEKLQVDAGKLDLDIINLKDQVAKWKDVAASCSDEVLQWKSDCKMLFDWKQELELEKQRLQEELQRVYDISPSLNPNRSVSNNYDVILRSSTPRDAQIVDITRRLRTL